MREAVPSPVTRGGVAQLVRARGSYPRRPGFESLHRHQSSLRARRPALKLPPLVAAVAAALRAAGPPARGETLVVGALRRRRLGRAPGRARDARAARGASGSWPRTSITACAPARPTTPASAPRLRAPRRADPGRAPPTCARAPSGTGRPRAGGAARALRVPAPGARRSRPPRSRSPTRATTRPRRCCCACCAAPGRRASRRCACAAARIAAAAARGLARRGARAPARARARLARGPDERRPRPPAQPRAARAAALPRARASTRACARRSPAPRGCSPTRPRTCAARPSGCSARIAREEDGRRSSCAAPALAQAPPAARPRRDPPGAARDGRAAPARRRPRRARAPARPLGGALRAGPCRCRAAGSRASRATTSASKSVRPCPESRIIRGEEMRDEVAVLYPEDEIARRVAELGAAIGRGVRRARDLRPRPDEGQHRLHGGPRSADPARPHRAPRARHLAPRARPPPGCMTEIVYTTAVPLQGRRRAAGRRHRRHRHHAQLPARPHPRARARESLRVVSLVDKPDARKIDLHPDWSAFTLPSPWPAGSWSATASTGWSATAACRSSARSPAGGAAGLTPRGARGAERSG